MQSFSKQVRKHKRILYDLFVTIENIIIGNSFIKRSFTDGCNKYELRSRLNHPIVLLAYEETASGEFILRKNNSYLELIGEENTQAENMTPNEQTANINIKNLKVNISNSEIFKQVSLASKRDINRRRIIYDLFVTIENIIVGASSVTKDVIEGMIIFKITSIRLHPTVIILYDLTSESGNYTSIFQLIDEQEKHISENIPYFGNMNVTAFEATTQQAETELSIETVTNDLHQYNYGVKTSQELVTIISSEYEKTKGNFTDNKLCFKRLRETETWPSTFEREQNLINVKIVDSNDDTEKETTVQKFNEEQLKKFRTGKEIYNYCNKSFPGLSKKVIPERMHAGEKFYRCQYCEKTFALSEHKKIHESPYTGRKPYKCEHCEKTFAQLPHSKQRERGHSGEKPHKCEYCKKTFARLSDKKKHERQHTGEKPYKCDYCEKKFAQLSNKKSHERQHTGEKPYKCDYCEKTFAHLYNKRSHERQHIGEKPFKCNYCEKIFAQLSDKKIHERLHTGEQPYKCDYCEKMFAQSSNKKSHERQHTGERPYKCDYCEKTFAHLYNKRSHERQHTGEKPFKCEYCKKSFAHISNKKKHERQHTGDKSYKCEYCEKSFAQLSHKKTHERQHTGEKPYKCVYCEKSFVQLVSRIKHERQHIGAIHAQ